MIKNKSVMLDTCVLKYLLKIKGQNDEKVFKNFELKKLKNYITHHGCSISVFTLFELLRHPLNQEAIFHMKEIRPKIMTFGDLDFGLCVDDNYDELLDADKCKEFQLALNPYLIKYTSNYCASILIFPFYYVINEIKISFDRKQLQFDSIKATERLNECVQCLENKLMENLTNNCIFSKSFIGNIIKKIYIWLGGIYFKWIYYYINDLDNFKFIEEAINNLKNLLQGIDLNPRFKNVDGSNVKANREVDPAYTLLMNLNKINSNKINDLKNVFIKRNKEMIRKIYNFEKNSIQNLFIIKNIEELFLYYISDKKREEKLERPIEKIFDANDILDSLTLSLAISAKTPLITTDNKLNEIIKNSGQDTTLNKVFVKNVFDKK